jgi:hypothetical protein
LATNQKFALRNLSRGHGSTHEELLGYMLDRLTPPEYQSDAYNSLLDYTRAGASNWTGSDTQLATKSAGLVHLILGSGDYQLV